MPNLIDNSFFVGNLNVPNPNTPQVSQRLDWFIKRYEAKCLEQIFGYELFQKFLSESSDRMNWIKSGAEFVESPSGKTKKWKGLIYDENNSMIASYVYYFILESEATNNTGIGVATSDAESGKSHSPADKMVFAWNMYASEGRELISFLWNKKVDGERVYPEFDLYQANAAFDSTRTLNVFGI
ncbi:MAG: hypothetical protein E6Q68_01680 [Polynucleobacter sp.]|nr:MAG: hypothetical protein E6Q68_01680 [Polynucleobacter sp.]